MIVSLVQSNVKAIYLNANKGYVGLDNWKILHSESSCKLTFTQFLLKVIAHTCLLTRVLAVVYPSTNIVMHKRPSYSCVFLHTHTCKYEQ